MGNSIIQDNMQNAMANEYALFQQNPQQYLLSKGLNVPQEVLGDPFKAVEYIINTGQGTQAQLEQFQSMINMRRR